MFNIGSGELFAILLAALILLGPARIPQFVRACAKGYREFIKVREQVDSTLSGLREEIEKEAAPAREASASVGRELDLLKRIAAPEGERLASGQLAGDNLTTADNPSCRRPGCQRRTCRRNRPGARRG